MLPLPPVIGWTLAAIGAAALSKVLVREWRLLQRSVFVIGRDDRIAYVEYVADQILEPDYDAAIAAVRRALQMDVTQ